jgi:hypothetical protein
VLRWGGTVARFLLGPRDAWLPALALVLPAVVCFSLEGRRLEPFEIGPYAKMELYTRLAAEGSQRVGTESRFQVHQPGPSFFYAAAPIYVLFGETTRAMAAASLAWNIVFLLAFMRGASRLAPGVGPLAAAIVLGALLWARGPGLMMSWFNIHVALLPFGVALLASARVATGEARALPVLVLAASMVMQCQVAWVPGVALPAVAGFVLLVLPAARRALRIPTCGPGLTLGTSAAALLVAFALWTLPVIDEFTGEYRNFHRLLAVGKARTPRPWLDTLGPAANALRLARGHPAEDALSVPPDRPLAFHSALVAAAVIVGGWLAARRRAATAALALVTAMALIAVPIAVRYVPGRFLAAYLFEWASIVTVTALLVAGTELLGRATRQHPPRPLAVGTLAALSGLLVASTVATSASMTRPRDATSAAIEDTTRAIQATVAADLPPGRRFLVRVAAQKNQDVEIGLILALDKAGLRFGVEPFGSCRLEGHFTPRGDEWAELLVGPLPSRPGAVPMGNPGGIRVVWQRLWGGVGDFAAQRSG